LENGVVLNPKMGSSKIEFWIENVEFPNVKEFKHSIINIEIFANLTFSKKFVLTILETLFERPQF
jgi:hypothetical protein